MAPLQQYLNSNQADAIIDFSLTTATVKVRVSECGTVMQCTDSFEGILWVAQGMAVDWLCGEGQEEPGGWTR